MNFFSTPSLDLTKDNDIAQYFSSLMSDINAPNKSVTLDAANRIYVQNKFELLDSFKKVLNEKFNGQFESVDFSNTTVAAQVRMFRTEKFLKKESFF